jgi:hypothetical protein
MTVAWSVFLVTLGAILYFATDLQVAHVSVDVLGLILMVVGDAGLILALVGQDVWSRRARRNKRGSPVVGPGG